MRRAVLCLVEAMSMCPRWLNTQEQAAKRSAAHSPSLETGHAAGAASCQGKCLQDDTWHREPAQPCFPPDCKGEVGFLLG